VARKGKRVVALLEEIIQIIQAGCFVAQHTFASLSDIFCYIRIALYAHIASSLHHSGIGLRQSGLFQCLFHIQFIRRNNGDASWWIHYQTPGDIAHDSVEPFSHGSNWRGNDPIIFILEQWISGLSIHCGVLLAGNTNHHWCARPVHAFVLVTHFCTSIYILYDRI
jgi:hypothetical protein